MNFDDSYMDDDLETKELVSRFESMLKKNKHEYFDADECNIIIEYYLQNNDLKSASLISRLASELHPDNPITLVIQAKQLISVSQAEKAYLLLKKHGYDSNDPDYLITLASCYSELGKHEDAIATYKKAVPFFEEDDRSDLYNSLSIEYESLGNIGECLNYLKKSLNNFPAEEIENQYIEIVKCYNALGTEEDGIEFFKQRIDKDPYDIPAWMMLGKLYGSLLLYEKAIDSYEYVIAIDPSYSKAYIDIAAWRHDLDEFDKAIEILEEAIQNGIKTAQIYCLIAECKYQLKDKAGSLVYYNKAINIDETAPESYAGIGCILLEDNDAASAVKFLSHAHQLAPFNTDYIFALVDAHNDLKQYDLSCQYVNEIIDLTPYDENAYIAKMEIMLAQEYVDEALMAIQQGLDHVGENALLLYREAYLLYITYRDEEALASLEKALLSDAEGYKEFLSFDTDMLTKDHKIMEMINKYVKKKKKTRKR